MFEGWQKRQNVNSKGIDNWDQILTLLDINYGTLGKVMEKWGRKTMNTLPSKGGPD